MKPLNVKSTMLHKLFDYIAPHYCCSCGDIGGLLCESCKYDIIHERFDGCLLCGRLSLLPSCSRCRSVISKTWCGGERSGGLEVLINRYKFEYAEAAYSSLGDIMLATLPQLPLETIIVPIPTVRAHIRQRGYDHAFLLARYIARERGLALAQPLRRRTATVQRGADKKTRIAQAKEAFRIVGSVKVDIPYLLIDDVVTTGSTLQYAAQALRGAGATTVWAAAVARQPLDEQR